MGRAPAHPPAKPSSAASTAPNGDWNVSQPREVTLNGIAHPVEIVSIDWR